MQLKLLAKMAWKNSWANIRFLDEGPVTLFLSIISQCRNEVFWLCYADRQALKNRKRSCLSLLCNQTYSLSHWKKSQACPRCLHSNCLHQLQLKKFLSPFSLDIFFRIPVAFPVWLWEISHSLTLFFHSFHPPAAFILLCLPGHLKETLTVFQTGLAEFDCGGVTSVLNQCTFKMEQSSWCTGKLQMLDSCRWLWYANAGCNRDLHWVYCLFCSLISEDLLSKGVKTGKPLLLPQLYFVIRILAENGHRNKANLFSLIQLSYTMFVFPWLLHKEESEEECCGHQCQVPLLRVPCYFWFSRDNSLLSQTQKSLGSHCSPVKELGQWSYSLLLQITSGVSCCPQGTNGWKAVGFSLTGPSWWVKPVLWIGSISDLAVSRREAVRRAEHCLCKMCAVSYLFFTGFYILR